MSESPDQPWYLDGKFIVGQFLAYGSAIAWVIWNYASITSQVAYNTHRIDIIENHGEATAVKIDGIAERISNLEGQQKTSINLLQDINANLHSGRR